MELRTLQPEAAMFWEVSAAFGWYVAIIGDRRESRYGQYSSGQTRFIMKVDRAIADVHTRHQLKIALIEKCLRGSSLPNGWMSDR